MSSLPSFPGKARTSSLSKTLSHGAAETIRPDLFEAGMGASHAEAGCTRHPWNALLRISGSKTISASNKTRSRLGRRRYQLCTETAVCQQTLSPFLAHRVISLPRCIGSLLERSGHQLKQVNRIYEYVP